MGKIKKKTFYVFKVLRYMINPNFSFLSHYFFGLVYYQKTEIDIDINEFAVHFTISTQFFDSFLIIQSETIRNIKKT